MRRNRIPVKEANLRITQYFGGSFVRTYITGYGNEPRSEIIGRIKPYRDFLIKEVRKSEFLGGKNRYCITEFQVNARDQDNWSAMVDWLESQRRTYEKVLYKVASDGH